MRPTTGGAVPKTTLREFLRRVWRERRVPPQSWDFARRRARRLLSRVPGLGRLAAGPDATELQPLIGRADLAPLGERTPVSLARESFRDVTTRLRSGDIPYFVTDSSDHRQSVGIFEEHRGAAIDMLSAAYEPRLFLSGLDSESLPQRLTRADQRLVAWHGAIGGPGLTFGPDFGTTVEFWARESAGFRRVRGGRPGLSKLFGTEPKTSIEVDGEPHPTFASFESEIRRKTVPYPVDLVITWVDDSDPAWRMDYERELAEARGLHPLASDLSRYRSWDLLRYSLRSIWWYTDFARRIYLVTSGHLPNWLNTDHARLTTVSHTQIMSAGALPTFNSHAIESRLHRLPDLADHYVYSNDDLLVSRPLGATSFFTREGLARITLGSEPIPGGPARDIDSPVDAAAKNGRALLSDTFGYVASRKLAHVPFPQIRALVEELEDRFPDDFDRTLHSRFRHRDDISVPAFLSQHGAIAMTRGVESEIRTAYVNVADRWAQERLDRLRLFRDVDIVCINETSIEDGDEDSVASMLRDYLDWALPAPSPFELDR